MYIFISDTFLGRSIAIYHNLVWSSGLYFPTTNRFNLTDDKEPWSCNNIYVCIIKSNEEMEHNTNICHYESLKSIFVRRFWHGRCVRFADPLPQSRPQWPADRLQVLFVQHYISFTLAVVAHTFLHLFLEPLPMVLSPWWQLVSPVRLFSQSADDRPADRQAISTRAPCSLALGSRQRPMMEKIDSF